MYFYVYVYIICYLYIGKYTYMLVFSDIKCICIITLKTSNYKGARDVDFKQFINKIIFKIIINFVFIK